MMSRYNSDIVSFLGLVKLLGLNNWLLLLRGELCDRPQSQPVN